jgi:hypothetical protein
MILLSQLAKVPFINGSTVLPLMKEPTINKWAMNLIINVVVSGIQLRTVHLWTLGIPVP